MLISRSVCADDTGQQTAVVMFAERVKVPTVRKRRTDQLSQSSGCGACSRRIHSRSLHRRPVSPGEPTFLCLCRWCWCRRLYLHNEVSLESAGHSHPNPPAHAAWFLATGSVSWWPDCRACLCTSVSNRTTHIFYKNIMFIFLLESSRV